MCASCYPDQTLAMPFPTKCTFQVVFGYINIICVILFKRKGKNYSVFKECDVSIGRYFSLSLIFL